MQMAQGAPGAMVPVVAVGLLPMAGGALGSTGTSMVNWRRNFPSVSKTWMRRLAPAARWMLFWASAAALLGVFDWAGLSPGSAPGVWPLASLASFSCGAM